MNGEICLFLLTEGQMKNLHVRAGSHHTWRKLNMLLHRYLLLLLGCRKKPDLSSAIARIRGEERQYDGQIKGIRKEDRKRDLRYERDRGIEQQMWGNSFNVRDGEKEGGR
jgi:hypothetical protein